MIPFAIAWLASATLFVLKVTGLVAISWFTVILPVVAMYTLFLFVLLIAFLIFMVN